MRYPEEFIRQVLDRTDMEALVSRYVNLRRSGSNLMGLCPFHSERSPSFSVSPSKGLYFCFGCHAGGSAITFVQQVENLDFTDAVEFLADRAGLPLPTVEEKSAGKPTVSRKRVLEMNRLSAKFFHRNLVDLNIGQKGREYLLGKRKLTQETVTHFGLGYAPDSYHALYDFLRQNGYHDEEIVSAYLGARSEKTGKIYDIFRNRVMFPIIDTVGNVVGFGGRVLDDSKPKYLNTGDTPAFKKSNHLFALNFAKDFCMERAILCEGYMDVIALHSAGFENAVATLGTAITPSHARIFEKYTKKVIISYDSDQAGQNAADKAMMILGEVGLDTRILKMTGAKDPDEFIRQNGADAFRRLLDESRSGFDFKLDTILSRHDLTVGSEKLKSANEICSVIADYPSAVERALYLDVVSEKLKLPREALEDTVKKIRFKKADRFRENEQRKAMASLRHFGDRIAPEATENPGIYASEEAVIGLLLGYEEHRVSVLNGKIPLTADDFSVSLFRRAFTALTEMQEKDGFRYELLGDTFSPEEMGRLREAEIKREEMTDNSENALKSAIISMKNKNENKNDSNLSLADRIAKKREKQKQRQMQDT